MDTAVGDPLLQLPFAAGEVLMDLNVSKSVVIEVVEAGIRERAQIRPNGQS